MTRLNLQQDRPQPSSRSQLPPPAPSTSSSSVPSISSPVATASSISASASVSSYRLFSSTAPDPLQPLRPPNHSALISNSLSASASTRPNISVSSSLPLLSSSATPTTSLAKSCLSPGSAAAAQESSTSRPDQVCCPDRPASDRTDRAHEPTVAHKAAASDPPAPSPQPKTPTIALLGLQVQDQLKTFFSMHHKLFDLVAFYVVMFAINGQMTSLPTRLEWIGFCVQSIVALRRAFQTSITHGIGLTSFLGMLDLLVGQLFLHQDRLELLPTVANILVYFYVINLTRGLVFGDSVSCLLWFLFGLVDIYRKDTAHSTASILDLTPYRVIPVHTVGFGLYILMSELVDVMLHSTEPDPIQGRYLNYVGVQKEGPVSIRSSRRSMPPTADPTSNLRFELCITEITPFTVSFCLNALSDTPSQEQPPSARDGSDPSRSDDATSTIATTTSVPALTDAVDLASIKVGSVASVLGASISRSVKSSAGSSSKQPAVSSSSSTGVTATTTTTATITPTISAKTLPTPRIISTSDIVIHVNFIPWKEVQYHFPDDQSFTVFGLTPSTDYEIEMKVHQFSSFVARVGTRAAPPGTPIPSMDFERSLTKPLEPTTKTQKSRRNRKGQKSQKDTGEKSTDAAAKSKTVSVSTSTSTFNSTATVPAASVAADHSVKCSSGVNVPESTGSAHFGSSQESDRVSSTEPKSVNQLILDELRASIQYSVEAAAAIKVSIKKLKRDQSKTETLLRQELEGIGRGHAKTVVQDQKRRQKLSFMQESIKQADAAALSLREETVQVRNWTRSTTPDLESLDSAAKALEKKIQSMQSTRRTELQPLQAESQRLEAEMKRLEGERQGWIGKAVQWQENEMAPLQLRLQRLEQQQSVWKVAAAANKEKGRQANLRIAALEEEIQKKDKQHQELNKSIQEIKDTNVTLKNSVDKEIAIWEGLERESDSDEKVMGIPSYHSPRTSVLQPSRHHQHLSMDLSSPSSLPSSPSLSSLSLLPRESSLQDSSMAWYSGAGSGESVGSATGLWLSPRSAFSSLVERDSQPQPALQRTISTGLTGEQGSLRRAVSLGHSSKSSTHDSSNFGSKGNGHGKSRAPWDYGASISLVGSNSMDNTGSGKAITTLPASNSLSSATE